MNSDIVIKAENIGKRYRIGKREAYLTLRDRISSLGSLFSKNQEENTDFWALKDINFEVKRGEVLGIIGRNGAGKSTLLKILSRITEPTNGKITMRGRVASLLEVGTGFNAELTGRENIYLNGAILGMTHREIKRKFDEIVDFSGVEKFLDTPVKHYSSGMYVRLAFAVAAHLEPEILVVDEVLAVGDAEFQKKCLGKMEEVSKKDGRTILFVSHNMAAVQNLCHNGILLENGQVKFQGKIQKVIDKYLLNNTINTLNGKKNLTTASRTYFSQKAIKQAWIEDKNHKAIDSVLMGEALTILFKYQINNFTPNNYYGVGIENSSGERIFSLNNQITNTKIYDKYEGKICFSFPELTLLPGTYFISLSIVDSNLQWIDFIEQALSFNVLPNDVFGTGRIPESSQGIIYLKGSINLN